MDDLLVREDKVCHPLLSKSSDKAALGTQKGASFGLKCVRMLLVAGICPDPLRELKRSPGPVTTIGVPTSKGEGREGRKAMGGEGEKEKDNLHPTLFLGPEI